jgi:hypothetical protein
MKLFLDAINETTQVITEATSTGEKKYFIEGIFAQAELKNRNGRIYPKRVLENAVRNFMPMVEAKRAIGELNHPSSPSINPERASHLIEKLTWEGNNLIGRAKILTSLPMGKIAKGLIDEGVKFGVSTRGMGSVTESKDAKIVGEDFVMNTIDLVSDPSGPECFVDGLLEGREWVLDAFGNWSMVEQATTFAKTINRKQLQEQKLALFEKFLRSIR